MNNILYKSSNNQSLYKVAQIHDTFDSDSPRYTNVNIDLSDYSKLNMDPHPNILGHKTIANEIINILKKSDVLSNNQQNHNQQDNSQLNNNQQDNSQLNDNQQNNSQLDNNQQDNSQLNNNQQNNSQLNNSQQDNSQSNNNQQNNSQLNDNPQNDSQLNDNQLDSSQLNDNQLDNSQLKTETATNQSANKQLFYSNKTYLENDLTIADGKLPKTGIKYISILLICFSTIIGIFSYIMYKKHKDII